MTANPFTGFRTVWLLGLLILGLPATAAAQPAPVRLDDIGRGSLLLREGEDDGEDDGYRPAPEVRTVVDIDVAGPVARTVVRQLFDNPGSGWMEGVYVFPLPDGAAVDGLKLRIGDRLIEGRIDERAKARRTYETARREGRKAALLESERPNIFTTSVANIGPGETVAIEIQYQERLRLKEGEFRLRFPMVVGPRYSPVEMQVARFTGAGWALPEDSDSDADRIAPPVRHPDAGPINPVRLTVRLQAGFPLAGIKSHHHAIDVEDLGEGRRTVSLTEESVPADRDFELTWAPSDTAAPRAGLFYEDTPEARYVLALLMPTTGAEAMAVPEARELTFILDISGSMAGESIRQAKAALGRALATLRPDDSFNVIAFSSDVRTLHRSPVPATAAALAQAGGWIAALEAEGGTEMAPALNSALEGPPAAGALRQVVFLTDGAVGNETALFRLIRSRLGDRRLFTIGIGSAPNSHFMSGAARAGRGSFVHIGNDGQVADRIDALIRQLSRPSLTGIAVEFPGATAELAPSPIPDLYVGEPVVFAARLPAGGSTAVITGRYGHQDVRFSLPLTGGQAAGGIAKLWARERIAQREDDSLLAEDRSAIDADILQLALSHGLVTRLTSLVAVDVTASRPADATLHRHDQETNLPAGWDFEKVFGDLRPQRRADLQGSPAPRIEPARASHQITRPVALPRTATPAAALMSLGLALLLIAGLVLAWLGLTARRTVARP